MDSTPITSPQPPADRHWLDEAALDLSALTEQSAPALRRRLQRALGLLKTINGGASLQDALRRPASTPFVPLIDACAADLGLQGDPRVGLVGRSTVCLYAYVRLQDDLVDEPKRVDRASIYAAEALLAAHLRLLAAAAPDPRAFAARSAIMTRFAEVAAAEVDSWRQRQPLPESLDWIGDKFLPMAVPMAALACVAGQPERIDALVAFVRSLGCALQMVNDVLNIAEDHAGGRPTPLLRWLDRDGTTAQPAPLRAVLLNHPALERALTIARRYADDAVHLAEQSGLPEMAEVARRARAGVDQAPQRLFRSLLGAA